MKALIVSQIGYDGEILKRGKFSERTFRLLLVQEENYLTIGILNDQMFALHNFKFSDECDIIGEIEVSDDMVKKALAFARAKAEFDALKETLKGLLEKRTPTLDK